ncbi:MAG: thioredoxin family protein [Saprospiraceae bacterium]|nr:thioredoxin family protein [Saprospiraceae bacterium]
MEKILTIITFLLISHFGFSQGIEFFHGSWEEALEEAAKQEKVIFVDAYASWCGPCKRMAKTVFPDEKAGEFFNEHFINVKLDYEKEEAATFRRKYPVQAFPTLYFIDYDGEVVHQQKGAQSVEGFVGLGKLVLSKIDRSGKYEEAYASGKREPELVLSYIKALNQAGKSSLKVANDYLDDAKDLSDETNLRILFEGTTEADSRLFDLLVANRVPLEKMYSREAFDEKIYTSCLRTVNKAVEFQFDMLHAEAVEKMAKHYPERAEEFAIEADIIYFQGTGNPEAYITACKAYAKKIIKGDDERILALARTMEKAFPLNEEVLKTAEKIRKKANRT